MEKPPYTVNRVPLTKISLRAPKVSRNYTARFFLLGRRPNRVIKIACFDSKLQFARNTCELKQAKQQACLPRERLVQGKKHEGKKVLPAAFTISKTLQHRNTIPNSAGTKKLKEMNILKQRRDNFLKMINL